MMTTTRKGPRRWARALIAAMAVTAIMAATAGANDYVVTFMKETYKAQAADQGGKIYHTWSVSTDFGNKLLVLTGEDRLRRQWLQEFSKASPLFLLSIPEKSSGAFEINTVFEIDICAIHPIDESFTGDPKKKKKRN